MLRPHEARRRRADEVEADARNEERFGLRAVGRAHGPFLNEDAADLAPLRFFGAVPQKIVGPFHAHGITEPGKRFRDEPAEGGGGRRVAAGQAQGRVDVAFR